MWGCVTPTKLPLGKRRRRGLTADAGSPARLRSPRERSPASCSPVRSLGVAGTAGVRTAVTPQPQRAPWTRARPMAAASYPGVVPGTALVSAFLPPPLDIEVLISHGTLLLIKITMQGSVKGQMGYHEAVSKS